MHASLTAAGGKLQGGKQREDKQEEPLPQEQQPPQEPQAQEPQEEDPQEQELNEEAVSLSFLCCKQMLSTATAAASVFMLKSGPCCQMNPSKLVLCPVN